jgi:hypothetical protein
VWHAVPNNNKKTFFCLPLLYVANLIFFVLALKGKQINKKNIHRREMLQ